MEAPRITYYARVIDNITREEIVGFTDASKSNTWYYGRCNGLLGGESEYIVEFDIWNNEPAFEAHTGDVDNDVADAINCRLTVWPDSDCVIKDNLLFDVNPSFMKARCDTFGYSDDFQYIKGGLMLRNITGNVRPGTKENPTGKILSSNDHARIQTKIVLPANTNLPSDRFGFVFAFYYDFIE